MEPVSRPNFPAGAFLWPATSAADDHADFVRFPCAPVMRKMPPKKAGLIPESRTGPPPPSPNVTVPTGVAGRLDGVAQTWTELLVCSPTAQPLEAEVAATQRRALSASCFVRSRVGMLPPAAPTTVGTTWSGPRSDLSGSDGGRDLRNLP